MRVRTYSVTGETLLSSGHLVAKLPNAAPASGDLAKGEGALWFDETNNELQYTYKRTDGTVRTATVTTA